MTRQGREEKLGVLTKRLDVLRRLTEGECYKRDLVADLDHSRSTINRAIDELSGVDLVRRTDEGFTATMAGRLAVERLSAFQADLDDLVAAESVVEPLPFDAPLDVAMVAGSDAVPASDPAPYRPLEPFHDDLVTARRYRGLLPSLDDPRQVRLLYEHVVIQDRPAELVVSPAVFETLRSEFPRQLSAMAEAERFRLFVGSPPVFAVGLVESGTAADPATRAYVVVFTESGAVHGSLANAGDEAVRWATEQFEAAKEAATERTAELRLETDDERSVAGNDPDGTIRGDRLPVSLEREGFVRLGVAYFREEPVADPTTAWRTGLTLPEVHTGFAVERTVPDDGHGTSVQQRPEGRDDEDATRQADPASSVTDELVDSLLDGQHSVVLGPPGSGKSTVCKQVACAWYDADHGPVCYRESGRGRPFESVAELERTLEHADGRALVVVEDAVRPEAASVFELLAAVEGRDDVSLLLDARESEWRDPATPPSGDPPLSVVSMPPLHERDAAQFVTRFEQTVGESIGLPAAALLEEVREEAREDDDDRVAGAVLLLLHRLATHADPLDDGSTSLQESVAALHDRLATDDLALDVCVLANALNATGLGFDPGLLYAVAEPDQYGAVDDAIERLTGTVLFTDGDGYRTVHESWSVAFLERMLETEGEELAAERFGDCLTAVLSLADDARRRDQIARHLATDVLGDVVEDPGGWADVVAEALYSLAEERPKLAALFGPDRDSVALPSACSERIAQQRPVWLGKAFLGAGRYEAAARVFRRLPTDGGSLEFERLLGLSEVAETNGEFEEAVDLAETAVDLATDRDAEQELGRAELRLGRVLVQREEYEAAEPHLRRALDRFDAADDQRRTASTLDSLGVVARRLAEYDTAEEYHRRSLELSRELGDRRGQARSHQHLGSVGLDRSDFDTAREQYERSLELDRYLGDRSAEAAVLENLGLVARHQGAYDEAREYHERSLAISEALGRAHGEARSLGNLGLLAKNEDRFEDAIDYYERSLELHREMGMEHGEAKACFNIAETAVQIPDSEMAREYAERARPTFEELDDRKGLAVTANVLGAAHRVDESYEEATEEFRRAIELFRSVGIPQGRAVARRNLGEVLRFMGETSEARDHWRTALETFEEVEAPQDQLATLEHLVETCRDVGDLDAARGWHDQAVELLAGVPDPLADQHRDWVEREGERLDDD